MEVYVSTGAAQLNENKHMRHLEPIRITGLFVFLLVAMTPAGLFAENLGFVGRDGTRFEVNGRPHYYMGASYFNAMNYGAGSEADRAKLRTDFENLAALGVTNVRIWASSEGTITNQRLTPTLQPSAQTFSETMFQGLDYALKVANDNNLRSVMVLNNNWEWSGGMNQYVEWSPTTNKGLYKDEWGQGPYHDQFYTDANTQADFQHFIDTIVNRENTAYPEGSRPLYKDDPTIFSWELANEPRYKNSDQTVLNNWIDTTADYIKSLDANHMVTTGSEGFFNQPATGNWWDNPAYTGTDFVANHASANIDYATVHIWPFNWGWYPDPNGYPKTAQELATEFLADHITSAQVDLGKPLVLEEFGLLRDGDDPDNPGSQPPGSPTTDRDALFQAYFDQLYDSAAADGPGAGSNFWTYEIDPPQEPQGMYAIYDPEDVSTLAIIAAEAARMNSLIPVAGDANFDGLVNGADLAKWQQNYDPLGLNDNTFDMGDWNCDGLINGADLALWQQNYNPIVLTGSSATTPEPATLLLLASGVLFLVTETRKTESKRRG